MLAETGGEIVGQLMVTFEWSDWRNGMMWRLESIYVRQDSRGRGVFIALFRHVETLARKTPGVAGIRLNVEKN